MNIPLPPITFIVSFAISLILYYIYPIVRYPAIYFLTIPLVLLGLLIAISSLYLILKNKTTIDPTKVPTVLIKSGIFSISRNPIYLSMLIILLGLDFYFFSLVSFVNIIIFFIVINYYIIPKEESIIISQFKREYKEYISRVRRWI